jgi:hypothetical protein
MRLSAPLQQIVRPLVEYRILLSLGLSAACGIVLNSLYPINQANPLLRLITLERPRFITVWYGAMTCSSTAHRS